jgi:hypothetical protein
MLKTDPLQPSVAHKFTQTFNYQKFVNFTQFGRKPWLSDHTSRSPFDYDGTNHTFKGIYGTDGRFNHQRGRFPSTLPSTHSAKVGNTRGDSRKEGGEPLAILAPEAPGVDAGFN